MGTFKPIAINQAKAMIDKMDVTIVDIRDVQAFKAGHIQNAVLVNDSNIEKFLKSADKNKPLLCCCYHGVSSHSAAEYFSKQGFKEVYSLEGGFEKWKTTHSFSQA